MAEDQYDHEPCCGSDCQGLACTDCMGTGHPHAPLSLEPPAYAVRNPYHWTDDPQGLQDSINRALENQAWPQVYAHGVTPDHQGAPITLHPGAMWTLPPHQNTPTTPAGGASSSEVPHSGEQTATPVEGDLMEPTPAQRRDAWLALVQHLERELLATRENAKALTSQARANAEAVREKAPRPFLLIQPGEEYAATAWAAQRLLDSITALTAPEVPRDDETGQGSILDALQGMQDHDFLAKRKAAELEPDCQAGQGDGHACGAMDCPLRTAPVCWRTLPSAPVDNPGGGES